MAFKIENEPTYLIITDLDTSVARITCFACGRTSYSKGDIENKYCGYCHLFHTFKYTEDRKEKLNSGIQFPGFIKS